MALSSFPARIVLSRLQIPKATPMPLPKINFLPIFCGLLFANKEIKNEITDAKAKANITKEFLWSGYGEFCCAFCTIPSPPDESIAIIRGIIYVLLVFCFLVVGMPDIITVGITIRIPIIFSIVSFSFQNKFPDNVGKINPKE